MSVPITKIGIPVTARPITSLVISSAGRSVQEIRNLRRRAFPEDEDDEGAADGGGKMGPGRFRRADQPERIRRADADADDPEQAEENCPGAHGRLVGRLQWLRFRGEAGHGRTSGAGVSAPGELVLPVSDWLRLADAPLCREREWTIGRMAIFDGRDIEVVKTSLGSGSWQTGSTLEECG